jgi:acetolactate synthase-1/2/3 large subunit
LHGGEIVAEVLAAHGVEFVFTLVGGHISPILTGSKARGIRVIDIRHEATTVFAADAVARLSGVPGVAAVTAGPGVTNTITALKNAQLAQSPVILIGGAAATILKGRGALQDIDQMALVRPHVKWARKVTQVRDVAPALVQAFAEAQSGVPGPVFVELPVDLLYPEPVVREMYGEMTGKGKSIGGRLRNWYVRRHVNQLFAGVGGQAAVSRRPVSVPFHDGSDIQKTLAFLRQAERPVLLVGSQALLPTVPGQAAVQAAALQAAVRRLGIPTYLSGMARGLLGRDPLHMRHKRTRALKESDLIVLAGVPCDFRLNYGRSLSRDATLVAINRHPDELQKNCSPDLPIRADAGHFLRALAEAWPGEPDLWASWLARLQERNEARDAEIMEMAREETAYVNPLAFFLELEKVVADESVMIGDGGDFVATASYILRPRSPLSWLDPGVFGTLGSGAGFALGAKLVRPESEVWLIYGDGSAGYSLAEFDTFHRHGIPIIAVVGNDASWAQIAREQVAIFEDPVATELVRSAYHTVAEGYGGEGLLVQEEAEVPGCLRQAQTMAREGRPVLLNLFIGQTDFRKGSISM